MFLFLYIWSCMLLSFISFFWLKCIVLTGVLASREEEDLLWLPVQYEARQINNSAFSGRDFCSWLFFLSNDLCFVVTVSFQLFWIPRHMTVLMFSIECFFSPLSLLFKVCVLQTDCYNKSHLLWCICSIILNSIVMLCMQFSIFF